jgi:hypothetical protein
MVEAKLLGKRTFLQAMLSQQDQSKNKQRQSKMQGLAGCYQTIFKFLTINKQVQMRLLCKRWYNDVVLLGMQVGSF